MFRLALAALLIPWQTAVIVAGPLSERVSESRPRDKRRASIAARSSAVQFIHRQARRAQKSGCLENWRRRSLLLLLLLLLLLRPIVVLERVE